MKSVFFRQQYGFVSKVFIITGFLCNMFLTIVSCFSTNSGQVEYQKTVDSIRTGAEQTDKYFHLIENKNIGIVTNQTGIIGKIHIVDSLLNAGFTVSKVFAPEHGFRGQAEAGEKISNSKDIKTGIQVVSLYGKNYKPNENDLNGIDIIIFDIQDVGVRFYTYISTLHYVMEACAENNIPLIVLDRPNPNGFYIDGPVLDMKFQSFIGLHKVPVIYGMTIGEFSTMINGEHWLKDSLHCDLTVVQLKNYTHTDLYTLPVAPSPNLQTMSAVYLYPSLCLFEGTVMSVGRGTDNPFEVFGHPQYPVKKFSFTPVSKHGSSSNPLYKDLKCFGENVCSFSDSIILHPKLRLSWLIDSYKLMNIKNEFFKPDMFDKLTGSDILRNQIIGNTSEDEIRKSWEKDIEEFKKIRKKYLIYQDF